MNVVQRLEQILIGRPFRISYQPLKDEIDPTSIPYLQNQSLKKLETVPQSKMTDPNKLALNLKEQFPGQETHILLPGQAFDVLGTRHGRGFGWYDRLLSTLPANILRIGVAHGHQLQSSALKRELWDEPIGWLIYQDQGKWQVHETKARSI